MISGLLQSLKNIYQSRSRTAVVVKQAGLSLLIKGLGIGVSLLYVPLLIGEMKADGYGVWITILSIANWIILLDVGLGNGLRNKIAEGVAKENFEQVRSYISTTYVVLSAIFTIVLVLFHIANPFVNWQAILNTESVSNRDLYFLTSIVFTFIIIRFIVQLIGVIFMAMQKPAANNGILALGSALSFAVVFIVSKLTHQANIILLGSIVSGVPVAVYIGATVFAFRKKYRHIRPSIDSVDFRNVRELTSLSFRFFFVQVTSIAIFSTSSFLIIQLYGPDEVTRYQVAFQLFNAIMMVYHVLLTPIWSSVTDAYARQDFKWLKLTVKRLVKLSLIFAVLVGCVAVSADFIYQAWLGPLIQIPIALTVSLAIYTVVNLFLAPFSAVINGLGKVKLTASLSWLGIVVFFVCAFCFSRLFDSSVSIALSLTLTSLIGLSVQPMQVYKIVNGTARGVWNR